MQSKLGWLPWSSDAQKCKTQLIFVVIDFFCVQVGFAIFDLVEFSKNFFFRTKSKRWFWRPGIDFDINQFISVLINRFWRARWNLDGENTFWFWKWVLTSTNGFWQTLLKTACSEQKVSFGFELEFSLNEHEWVKNQSELLKILTTAFVFIHEKHFCFPKVIFQKWSA